MKYIVCEKPHEFILKEKPMPSRKKGEVLLKIRKIGVCGTDIHAFGGTQPYFEYPRILGHELAAEYIEGEAEGYKPGDKVTFIPYFHCGECVACRNGLTNCCAKIKVFGVHIDGGMAEYITIPEQYLLHGQGLDYDQLALVEPLAIAAHGVRRAAVNANDTVLVMGAGPIGVGLMQFAKIAGAKVIALDINEYRLNFCKTELNVDATINPTLEDVTSRLIEITNGDMPTVVIDATGNRNVMNSAFNYIAHGGRFVLVGLQKGELSFSHPDFHKRESTLMSSRNATIDDFTYVIDCLKKGKIDPKKYITHRAKFSEMINEFEKWIDPKNNVIKALIELD
ncbi:zinc-binding alcohol dehydrogenase family protein [Flavobacterium cellulosilyticum]|uniref:Zinc-binding alcohol dehydrogenase family protein n=1 Tax=Flavobacterium cellulosilyticum TaxID=2541731 RepID=A0A4R5CHQ0_9FLAO|nr:zinc-binding alcohol dehydrogenase family protein [Flavobacterium cellulosilyticum]TDD98050.1 zinc-binding alcohol dehydrogenase family protein [Flavobacterium cellulosilyticum]